MLKKLLPPAYLHQQLLKRGSRYFVTAGADPCLLNFSNYLLDHNADANTDSETGASHCFSAVNAQTAVATAAGFAFNQPRIKDRLCSAGKGSDLTVPCVLASGTEIGGIAQSLLAFQSDISYNLPLLLLIGWSGATPGRLDEDVADLSHEALGTQPTETLEDQWRIKATQEMRKQKPQKPAAGSMVRRSRPEELQPYCTGHGEQLENVLSAIDVPYSVVPRININPNKVSSMQDYFFLLDVIVDKAFYHLLHGRRTPFAILFPENIFQPYHCSSARGFGDSTHHSDGGVRLLTRRDVLEQIVRQAGPNDVLLCNVGLTGEEMADIQLALRSKNATFLPVSGAGLISSVAAGIALSDSTVPGGEQRSIIVIDGDGSCLAELSGLANVGNWSAEVRFSPANRNRTLPCALHRFKHIVLNNGSADSSSTRYYYQQRAGEAVEVLDFQNGAPTAALDVSLSHVAKACGYRVLNHELRPASTSGAVNLKQSLYSPGEDPVMDRAELLDALTLLAKADGPCFLEVLVSSSTTAPVSAPVKRVEAAEAESAEELLQFAGPPSIAKRMTSAEHGKEFTEALRRDAD